MRVALLTGVAAAALFGAAGAQAQTIYAADPPAAVVTTAPVLATTPGYVYAVPAPPFGPFTPQYIVTQPTIVVAPPASTAVTSSVAIAPRERVIERERVVVTPRSRVASPRERVVVRERVVIAPDDPVVVAPRETGIITTGGSFTTGSSYGCFIDRNGFERCY
jgi:hypothetical protein